MIKYKWLTVYQSPYLIFMCDKCLKTFQLETHMYQGVHMLNPWPCVICKSDGPNMLLSSVDTPYGVHEVYDD